VLAAVGEVIAMDHAIGQSVVAFDQCRLEIMLYGFLQGMANHLFYLNSRCAHLAYAILHFFLHPYGARA
jgi:hypothetical protein